MVQYKNPLIIKFTSKGDGRIEQMDQRSVNIDSSAKWADYKNTLSDALSSGFDYVMVSFDDGFANPHPDADMMKSTNIKINSLIADAKKRDIKVFNRFDGQLYLLNPDFKSQKTPYYATDEAIMDKFNRVVDASGEYEWQSQQAEIWQRFASIMPLGGPGDKFVPDHKSMLANPSRGLSENDLDGFFSWQTGKPVIPGFMNNDMVGFPNMSATQYPDIELFVGDKPVPSIPIAIRTGGNAGYVIPMRNVTGKYAKFQVGTDISPINVRLKASAPDGVSVQKKEFFDKKSDRYTFKLQDGRDCDLHVKSASNDAIFFEDVHGEFQVSLKEDVKPKLLERGYVIPPIIDKLSVVPNAKYIWPAPGTLTGSKEVRETVTPSNAGFVQARPPKNGSDEYIILVAEGALKGIITAKYLDVKDSSGISLADKIAGNRGLIVAQVPGVAESFIKSVSHIYTDTDLKIAGTYIAMDADGRENLNVARGIHDSVRVLQQYSPVSVLSWDPAQKGIDDALLSVAQGRITVDDMKVKWGSAEELFPLDKASAPNPYKLDGTRANKGSYAIPDWLSDYRQSLAEAENKRNRERQLSEAVQHATEKGSEDSQVAESMGQETAVSSQQFEQELAVLNQAHEAQVRALAEKYIDTIDLSQYGITL